MWTEENFFEFSCLLVTYLVTLALGLTKFCVTFDTPQSQQDNQSTTGLRYYKKFKDLDNVFIVSLITSLATNYFLNERQLMFYITSMAIYTVIDLWIKFCIVIKTLNIKVTTGPTKSSESVSDVVKEKAKCCNHNPCCSVCSPKYSGSTSNSNTSNN
jgi:hypothetical protein